MTPLHDPSIEAQEFIAQQFFSRYTTNMHHCVSSVFLILWSASVFAMFSGNPGDPALMEKGIASPFSCISFRAGFFVDWMYKQRFKEEFLIKEEVRTKNQLSTFSGIATLNFIKRLDLYAYLGSSQAQVDEQIYSKRAFSWCVGSKLVFLKHKNLFFGADLKYFETDQKPKYFVVESLPYNIVGEFRAKYFEAQGALGMSYRASHFSPYINATYIYTHISHFPSEVAIRFPDEDLIGSTDNIPPSMFCKKRWGMALGLSLLDASKAALAFEWRAFNQNGVNINGELRF